MGGAVERLTSLVATEDRYDIPFEALREAQVEAMNERFQTRREEIKLLGHRAREADLDAVRSHEEVVPLLFPHTAYKSYPEGWLMEERWDRLGKWLDTVSTYRVPPQDRSRIKDMDDWIEQLQVGGHYVSCSSGTTGKSAMLVASGKDMEWCKTEAVKAYSWGSGVKPARDRLMFGLAAVAQVARNQATGEAYTAALQDPTAARFAYPVPPITVGGSPRWWCCGRRSRMARQSLAISRNSRRFRLSAAKGCGRRGRHYRQGVGGGAPWQAARDGSLGRPLQCREGGARHGLWRQGF